MRNLKGVTSTTSKANNETYAHKAQYNPGRKAYVDKSSNYVYRTQEPETRSYRREVCIVGGGGIPPELRALLDEIDAEEEHHLDADRHRMDKEFASKMYTYYADQIEYANNPLDMMTSPTARKLSSLSRSCSKEA